MKNNAMTFLLVVAGFVIVLYLVHNWNHQTPVSNDGEVSLDDVNVEHVSPAMSAADSVVAGDDPRAGDGDLAAPVPSDGSGQLIGAGLQDDMNAGGNEEAQRLRQASCFPKEQLLPQELLPQDNSSTWAQVNPQGTGTLKDKNFLQAGHHIGINTVGQTLRNANLGLRSEPPCPQVVVSPWMQTTIEPDTNRRPFELNGCA